MKKKSLRYFMKVLERVMMDEISYCIMDFSTECNERVWLEGLKH